MKCSGLAVMTLIASGSGASPGYIVGQRRAYGNSPWAGVAIGELYLYLLSYSSWTLSGIHLMSGCTCPFLYIEYNNMRVSR